MMKTDIFSYVKRDDSKIVRSPHVIYHDSEKDRIDYYCPCGCGTLVMLPVDGDEWMVEVSREKATVTPSVLMKNKCKSHYFIRNNKVIWA